MALAWWQHRVGASGEAGIGREGDPTWPRLLDEKRCGEKRGVPSRHKEKEKLVFFTVQREKRREKRRGGRTYRSGSRTEEAQGYY